MTVVESSATRVRSKGTWTYAVPAQQSGTKISVIATMQCSKKNPIVYTPSSVVNPQRVVLAATDTQPQGICAIFGWFPGCGGDNSGQAAKSNLDTVQDVPTDVPPTTQADQSLQLGSFSSGRVVSAQCPTVTIQY